MELPALGGAAAASGVAHSEQNFAPGEFEVPHVGHMAANRVAHSLQNLAPVGFSVPQFGQVKLLPRHHRLCSVAQPSAH
jgi:hypothetical protein